MIMFPAFSFSHRTCHITPRLTVKIRARKRTTITANKTTINIVISYHFQPSFVNGSMSIDHATRFLLNNIAAAVKGPR